MLTRPRTTPPRYWCEATAHTHDATTYRLGSGPAATPRLALRWLHTRAAHIADQLDDHAAGPLRAWITDQAAYEHALTALTRGGIYTHAATDTTTRYLLTARPTTRT